METEKVIDSRSEIIWALIACACAIPWLSYVVFEYINLDFWRDEMYSLDHFVFVPIKTIVTDYHIPNNHILANLLNHIFLYTFDLEDTDLLRYPWKIRILMLLYTIITFVYVYRIGRNFFHPLTGIFSVMILGSTLPFLNFAVQVRGYSLSIMLNAISIYYIARYHKIGRKKDIILIFFSVCLLIYTIPSNIYIVASMMTLWVFLAIFQDSTSKHTISGRELALSVSILAGTVAAAILYLPLLPSIIENRYVMGSYVETRGSNFQTLVMMIQFFGHLTFDRYFILAPIIYTALQLYRKHFYFRKSYKSIILLFLSVSTIFPFIFSALRGDNPYDRTFIPVVIPFSILWGILLSWTANQLNHRTKIFFFTLTFCALALSFESTVTYRDNLLKSSIEKGKDIQNVLVNYYQKYYAPSIYMRDFADHYEEGGFFIRDGWVDKAALRYMLYWMEIYGKSINEWEKSLEYGMKEEWLRSEKPIYVFTNNPDAPTALETTYPELRCRRITPTGYLGMVVRCDHRNRSEQPVSRNVSRPSISLGRGWYGAENLGAQTYRWGSANNRIWLVNPYDRPIHVTLALTLESYETARPAELWDGRRLLARWEVQRVQRTYRLGITIAPGHTRLQLRAPTTYDPRSKRELSVSALQWRVADYVPVERR